MAIPGARVEHVANDYNGLKSLRSGKRKEELGEKLKPTRRRAVKSLGKYDI